MDGLESLIRRVRISPHGEQVDVPVPHPGHLERKRARFRVAIMRAGEQLHPRARDAKCSR